MPLIHGALTDSVLGGFYEAYDHMGHGFLEAHCASALALELTTRGHHVAREVAVPVFYKGEKLGLQRLDMLVDDVLLVEVKATEQLHPAAIAQVRSYLRGTRLELGLVVNFGIRPRFERVLPTNDRKRTAFATECTENGTPAQVRSRLRR